MRTVEVIEHNGVKFRRYPDSKNRSDRVYFTPGPADRLKGVRRLHEELWMEAHGPIPSGCHVHHKDGDPLNNQLENLECMTAAAHMAAHGGVCSDRKRENLAQIRPLAAAWHSSPEGLAWHRQHAYESIRAVPLVPHTCEQCGASFETQAKSTNRFCSNACKSAHRRASGLDDEDRECVICGTGFRVNRYAKKVTCSRACAGRHQSRTKTSRREAALPQ